MRETRVAAAADGRVADGRAVAVGRAAAPTFAPVRTTPPKTAPELARRRGAQPAGTAAILAAAGVGLRFGASEAKQYVELCGLPILAWALMALDRAPSVGLVVVTCPPGRVEHTRHLMERSVSVSTRVAYVEGGATRQESVACGLAALRGDYDLIAVHDGARPLVTAQAIEAVICAVRDNAALAGAIAAAPATDTLKLVEHDVVVATPERSFYWSAMTPQVFRRAALTAAYAAAAAEGFVGTDDASLVERQGGRVLCVETPRDNIKVTVPEDMAVAEAVLRARLAAEGGFAGCDR